MIKQSVVEGGGGGKLSKCMCALFYLATCFWPLGPSSGARPENIFKNNIT